LSSYIKPYWPHGLEFLWDFSSVATAIGGWMLHINSRLPALHAEPGCASDESKMDVIEESTCGVEARYELPVAQISLSAGVSGIAIAAGSSRRYVLVVPADIASDM
jgi:hypothetical protein